MRRRQFIGLIGGAAVVPLVATAQRADRIRRIGVLMNLAADHPEAQARRAQFEQGLQKLGWINGTNVQIDYRWAAEDSGRLRRYAAELVALAPDAILANATPSVAALQEATRTIPIVFVNVTDPVGAGFVASLARPGRNVTGFLLFEFSLGAKWLELLKEIMPNVARVAVIRDASNAGGIGQFGAIQAVAPSLGVELHPIDVQDASEIERTVAAFVRGPNDGLVVTSSTLAFVYRDRIIGLAARHRLPSVYNVREFSDRGGLISYGPDLQGGLRQAPSYIDRILKGEKPADLPVQAPTKYELVINLKTAKELGISVPLALIARADDLIQ